MLLFKEFTIRACLLRYLILVTSLLLPFSVASCGCNNSGKPNRKHNRQEKSLNMEVAPKNLTGEDKEVIVSFKLIDNKIVDLTKYRLRITITEGKEGSKINYMDGANKPQYVTSLVEENVSHFFPAKQLKPDRAPLKIAFTIVPSSGINSMVVLFELLDENNIKVKTCPVTWKNKATSPVELKIGKLEYDQASGTIIYNIQNLGKETAKHIQLRYTNISIYDNEQPVLLNGQQASTIELTNIAGGKTTCDQTLTIDFKSATHAKFKFELLQQSNIVVTQELEVGMTLLKLVAVSPTSLIGANKLFMFKIEKASLNIVIDYTKLSLDVMPVSNGPAKVLYNNVKVERILGTALENIDNTIYLNIKPNTAMSAVFSLQLMYEGKPMGNVQTFSWYTINQSTEVLLKAIKSNADAGAVCELLNREDIQVNAADELRNTPLHYATECANIEVIQSLLGKGADVNTRGMCDWTPLHYAAKSGNVGAIKLLLGKEVNINSIGLYGETPLHVVAGTGNLEAIKLLIDKGADVNAIEDFGYGRATPVEYAANAGDIESIEFLLSQGVDINNIYGDDHTSLLHVMAEDDRNIEVAKFLLKKGIDVNVKNEYGSTPLHYAAAEGHKDTVAIIQLLLANGADVNAIAKCDGMTPLHKAVIRGVEKNVEVLLVNGADVKVQDNEQHTPLHYTVLNREDESSISIIKRLLANGADINATDKDGDTLLHLAIQRNCTKIIQLLLNKKDSGIRINIKNNDHKTPYNLARESNNGEIRRLFGI